MKYKVNRARKKMGRNDPCPCGSGHKYKKCCLLNRAGSSQHPRTNERQQRKRLKEERGNSVWSPPLKLKMSEVILDLADDFLQAIRTKAQIKNAIGLTCVAWNLAVMFSPDQCEQALEGFLKTMPIKAQQDMRALIHSIMTKKHQYYPDLNRVIADFDCSGSEDDFQLNIVSTIIPAADSLPV